MQNFPTREEIESIVSQELMALDMLEVPAETLPEALAQTISGIIEQTYDDFVRLQNFNLYGGSSINAFCAMRRRVMSQKKGGLSLERTMEKQGVVSDLKEIHKSSFFLITKLQICLHLDSGLKNQLKQLFTKFVEARISNRRSGFIKMIKKNDDFGMKLFQTIGEFRPYEVFFKRLGQILFADDIESLQTWNDVFEIDKVDPVEDPKKVEADLDWVEKIRHMPGLAPKTCISLKGKLEKHLKDLIGDSLSVAFDREGRCVISGTVKMYGSIETVTDEMVKLSEAWNQKWSNENDPSSRLQIKIDLASSSTSSGDSNMDN